MKCAYGDRGPPRQLDQVEEWLFTLGFAWATNERATVTARGAQAHVFSESCTVCHRSEFESRIVSNQSRLF